MLKNLYLAVIAVGALGAATLLPRLVEGDQPSFFSVLLGDVSAGQVDRLQVGSPVNTPGSQSSSELVTSKPQ